MLLVAAVFIYEARVLLLLLLRLETHVVQVAQPELAVFCDEEVLGLNVAVRKAQFFLQEEQGSDTLQKELLNDVSCEEFPAVCVLADPFCESAGCLFRDEGETVVGAEELQFGDVAETEDFQDLARLFLFDFLQLFEGVYRALRIFRAFYTYFLHRDALGRVVIAGVTVYGGV